MIFVSVDYDHFEAYSFKFTKDAEMELDNESDAGTLQRVQRAVKSRKNGQPLRIVSMLPCRRIYTARLC